MRSRAALTLLALLVLAVPLSHLQLQQVDGRWLLAVDGRQVDVAGHASDRINRMLRDCQDVRALDPQQPAHARVAAALGQYSAPDSLDLRLVNLWQRGEWLLAEVEFKTLAPVVVVLHGGAERVQVLAQGVWSGSTHPHWPAPFIRHYLASRVHEAPADLLACFEPALPLFRSGRPPAPASTG